VLARRGPLDHGSMTVQGCLSSGRERINGTSSQQSSVSPGSGHQLRRPGRTAFPAASSRPPGPTDDCSLLVIVEHSAASYVERRVARESSASFLTSFLNICPRSA